MHARCAVRAEPEEQQQRGQECAGDEGVDGTQAGVRDQWGDEAAREVGGVHEDKEVGGFGGGEVQGCLRVGDDVVEAEVDAPEGEEETGHDEEVRDVGEGGPVHLRRAFANGAGSFAGDEVGWDEGYEDDQSDDLYFLLAICVGGILLGRGNNHGRTSNSPAKADFGDQFLADGRKDHPTHRTTCTGHTGCYTQILPKVRHESLRPSSKGQAHTDSCSNALNEHEVPVLFTPARGQDAREEQNAATVEAVMETSFVYLSAGDDGHEEEEEYLKGADPGDAGRGVLPEEHSLVVSLEDAV